MVREALSRADQFLSELPDEEDTGGFFTDDVVEEDVGTWGKGVENALVSFAWRGSELGLLDGKLPDECLPKDSDKLPA